MSWIDLEFVKKNVLKFLKKCPRKSCNVLESKIKKIMGTMYWLYGNWCMFEHTYVYRYPNTMVMMTKKSCINSLHVYYAHPNLLGVWALIHIYVTNYSCLVRWEERMRNICLSAQRIFLSIFRGILHQKQPYTKNLISNLVKGQLQIDL